METTIMGYMGGCQNHGPFLGTLNIWCRIIKGTQKGTIILTTTRMPACRVLKTGQRRRHRGLGFRVYGSAEKGPAPSKVIRKSHEKVTYSHPFKLK